MLVDKRGGQAHIYFEKMPGTILENKPATGLAVVLFGLVIEVSPEENVSEVLLDLSCPFRFSAIQESLASVTAAFQRLIVSAEHRQRLQLVDLCCGSKQRLMVLDKAVGCFVEPGYGEFSPA